MKKNFLTLAVCSTISMALVSCLTNSKDSSDREPAAVAYDSPDLQKFLASDPFTKDGYDHNQDGSYSNRHFQFGAELSKEQELREMAGREIWFKSAPNERFHTYYYPQKINSPIAWYKVLRSDRREQRFNSWGLINDPDCCTPGLNCDAKNLKYHGRSITKQDTFNWDYCPGDEALLDSLKDPARSAWHDPACDHPVLRAADSLDNKPRESRCELAFGNSAGTVGYRKFPNPRFNAQRWAKAGDWAGFEKKMTESEIDASIEPPFRIGKACASCHAAFDPLNPPADMNHPTWKNIKGETGNQYINISAILASGAKQDTLEYQMFVHARAGVVDTSAIPIDFVNNAGTINAIINFPKRPTFKDHVTRWDNVENCSGANCQNITYPDGRKKSWQKTSGTREVMHILKGGEDSVGADIAVQRVYVNIGMCAEQCWVNHLTNVREIDPAQRGFGQTPFDIAQCRADCPSWRANEDRVGDILSYLLSRRPTDLKDALFKAKPEAFRENDLETYLNTRYGGSSRSNMVQTGKEIFAKNCAGCHSSQNTNKNDMSPPENFDGVNFSAKEVLPSGEELRADWMGNDKSTRVEEVGTFKCRSLHSNHLQGHVWSDFASDTYKARNPNVVNARSEKQAGGRGYMRNISLLNAWAHAPFMHNNAIGPELCGKEPDLNFNPWRTTVEGYQVYPGTKYNCEMYFNPSVEARLKIFEMSMDELLTPSEKRRKKIARNDQPVRIPLGLKVKLLSSAESLYLELPAGRPTNALTSLDLKVFGLDIAGSIPYYEAWAAAAKEQKPSALMAFNQYWIKKMNNEANGLEMAQTVLGTIETLRISSLKDLKKPAAFLDAIKKDQDRRLNIYLKYYSNCDAGYENMGHDFGTGLSNDEKRALKAFLATL